MAGVGIVTCQAPDFPQQTWRYRDSSRPPFDPVVFDVDALRARGLLTGVASAGRGGTMFFELDGEPLVLREFRRGGLVRHVSRRSYVQMGLERSRAMREFALLLELESLRLPAPVIFAARRTRRGMLETGELVTHLLPGSSFAEQARAATASGAATRSPWVAEPGGLPGAVGRCIARFHAAGVEHADLNAHNILVDEASGAVSLLDFDGGIRHVGVSVTPNTGWAARNLSRLARSLERLGVSSVFNDLESAWRAALQPSNPSASR
jgi:3-deoxy-D-manno-octulosonic acid kinase